jgi:hypothetical protein
VDGGHGVVLIPVEVQGAVYVSGAKVSRAGGVVGTVANAEAKKAWGVGVGMGGGQTRA